MLYIKRTYLDLFCNGDKETTRIFSTVKTLIKTISLNIDETKMLSKLIRENNLAMLPSHFSLERSSDLSTVFNLQAAHRELVLCILPLILSMRSLKRSIVEKTVQYHGSIQIPQSNIRWKAPAVRGNTPYCTRTPFKNLISGIYQKAFIIGSYVPCRVCYASMTSDPRVYARG